MDPLFRHYFKVTLIIIGTFLFAACSTDDVGDPLPDEGDIIEPLAFEVDNTIKQTVSELPGFNGGTPRPVATIVDRDGIQANFVANEIWFTSSDPAELDAFLTRWGGSVVSEIIPTRKHDLAGMKNQYLIAVDASTVDASDLTDDLLKLEANGVGNHRVSSDQALKLLAIATKEVISGVPVGINWVGSGSSYSDRTIQDAPTGDLMDGIANYDANAFTWPTHNIDSVQDIGVAEAWRAMDAAGKLGNRVKIGILDMGFSPDADTPSGWLALSNVPLTDPIGTENLLDCGGPCPWHGTNVSNAAMAVPDNGFGSAGPAGPIADPVLVFTLYDYFTATGAILMARAAGAKIINMSYGAPVPAILAHTVLPFDASTFLFSQAGMLLFAAAGNDGRNVDSTICLFGACVERRWYTPCENSGVICIGGIANNSKNRDPDSNYGNEHVDLFAPFTMLLGPDPDNTDNRARSSHGTSYSSPFTAGVAALIKAANPGLSSRGVQSILLSTAHSSPDEKVGRYVNARAAVIKALGNIAPNVSITSPSDWSTRQLNHTISFNALVSDFEDGTALSCCTFKWSSNVDGELATSFGFTHAFTTVGSRAITLEVTDQGGATASATVSLVIENSTPVATITKPIADELILRDVQYTLRGSAFDSNEPNAVLDCSNLTWRSSNVLDAFPVVGCDVNVTFTTNGPRLLSLTAVDPQGATHIATVNVVVGDTPANLPPSVEIRSPANNLVISPFNPLELRSTASDPEGATALSYEWKAIFPYNVRTGTGTNTSIISTVDGEFWLPEDNIDFGRGDIDMFIKIQLDVTDPEGNTGSDFVIVRAQLIL